MADLQMCTCGLRVKKGDMLTHRGSKRCELAKEAKRKKDEEMWEAGREERFNKLPPRAKERYIEEENRAMIDWEYSAFN
jgi:hypothetical protein